MGSCFGTNAAKLAQQSHKQIEHRLREDQALKKRVFFTGSPECIMNIFGTIEGSSVHQIQNSSTLLIAGYLRELKLQFYFYIPSELQLLCTKFYGHIEPPNHYEFAPVIHRIQSPSYRTSSEYPLNPRNESHDAAISPTNSSSDTDSLPYNSAIMQNDTYSSDSIDKHIEYQLNFPKASAGATQLNITYHNLQCFQKKKDYYLKWIHLLDNSLSVIFVADLSQLCSSADRKLLTKDLEKFRRLMYYSHGKYDSKMPILVLSGVGKFNECLCKRMYRKQFEAQFKSFIFDRRSKRMYSEQAMHYIKQKYVAIFENNLVHGAHHWNPRKKKAQNLFIRVIYDVNDICEVQSVWYKLNKTLIHQNIMHELRTGGIAL